MLERGAELHVMLPFERNDFYLTSVDFGLPEMADWRRRCDAVLERATVIHYATRESYLGDDVLFAFANTVMFGLAIMRAAELGVTPAALTVLDPASQMLVGGTKHHLDEWTERGNETYTIDLAALRTRREDDTAAAPQQVKTAEQHAAHQNARREIKVMIFADVQNFSKLSEAQTPAFFLLFLAEVAALVDASPTKPVFCNTWGDGLFLVFDHVVDGADFAMRLLDRIESIDWTGVGLPGDISVRLGMHAGPVYPTQHPILRRGDFFGSHVNRAARIEPVTTPGCAYTSEQFAAALSVEHPHGFVCEYVGIEQLAKEYDRIPLYRLSGRR
jgi:class 3 adenylate cyclase